MKPNQINIVIILSLAISGCFKKEWEGFVYPNKNNLSEHINIGSYKTLEECRASAINALNKTSSVATGDYECGLSCESKSGISGFKVCEKIER